MPPARKKSSSRKSAASKSASTSGASSKNVRAAFVYVATLAGGLGAKEKVERILEGKEEE